MPEFVLSHRFHLYRKDRLSCLSHRNLQLSAIPHIPPVPKSPAELSFPLETSTQRVRTSRLQFTWCDVASHFPIWMCFGALLLLAPSAQHQITVLITNFYLEALFELAVTSAATKIRECKKVIWHLHQSHFPRLPLLIGPD